MLIVYGAADCCSGLLVFGCFDRFPHSHPELLKQWVVNMQREGFTPSETAVLCSGHFEEHCFDRTGQTVHLHEGAVPTIFSHLPHMTEVSPSG